MASDGNGSPRPRSDAAWSRRKLKYYHWCLWTGIYRVTRGNRKCDNSIVLVLHDAVLAARHEVTAALFFLGRSSTRAVFWQAPSSAGSWGEDVQRRPRPAG